MQNAVITRLPVRLSGEAFRAGVLLAYIAAGAAAPPQPMSLQPVVINVAPGERQAFPGFGVSALNYRHDYQKLEIRRN